MCSSHCLCPMVLKTILPVVYEGVNGVRVVATQRDKSGPSGIDRVEV